jgi:ArsR family transcriptional regulator, arsenate/arsenite/antimonite-responsive transcriptional repressor
MSDLSTTFAALSDETRRRILTLLRDGSKTAGEIAAEFSLSKPTISHHLKVLEEAGLLRSERRGTFIVYALQSNVLEDIAQAVLEMTAAIPRRKSKKAP